MWSNWNAPLANKSYVIVASTVGQLGPACDRLPNLVTEPESIPAVVSAPANLAEFITSSMPVTFPPTPGGPVVYIGVS